MRYKNSIFEARAIINAGTRPVGCVFDKKNEPRASPFPTRASDKYSLLTKLIILTA